jgi:hypothetical protein
MVAVATNLLNIFMAFSREQNEGLLNGAISSVSPVREISSFSTSSNFRSNLEYQFCSRVFQEIL